MTQTPAQPLRSDLLAPEALQITSPASGEAWAADSLHPITWQVGEAVAAVAVEVSFDQGTTWSPCCDASTGASGASVPCENGAGGLLLRAPNRPGSGCLIRVRGLGADAAADVAEIHLIPSQQVHDYRWTEVTANASFAGRDGAGALTFNGRMWLLGGWNPQDRVHFPTICNSEVWSSPDGLNWRLELVQAPWEGRHTAGYAVHDGKMWIIGGDANQRHYQWDVWSSPNGVTWTLVTDKVPWGPRVLHYTVAHRGKLWVMGGQTLPQFAPEVQDTLFYDDVWCSEDGAHWSRVLEHAPWPARGMIGGAAVLRDRIWLLGGGRYDTPQFPDRTFFNDVWSSEDGITWERHALRAPWVARQYHDVAVFDDRLWVMEGYDGVGNRNDVWYSEDGLNWYELPDTPWAPRHAASVFVHDGALWMVAGNNMFPDVWKLTRGRATSSP